MDHNVDARDGYTPAQLARISGVSVRTLHHYDQIGLLVPARRDNGYRVYRPADVKRLQQILIFRGLGVELAQIAPLLDSSQQDQAQAMRQHLVALRQRRREIDQLINTVESTIDHLEGHPNHQEGHSDMNIEQQNIDQQKDKQAFDALKQQVVDENECVYGEEIRAKYGDKTVNAANEKLLRMGQAEWTDVNQLGEDILEQLSLAMEQGDPAGDEAARLVDMHRTWLCAYWPTGTYCTQAHRGLADMYVADERFTSYYDDACGEGATQFLRDAIFAATEQGR